MTTHILTCGESTISSPDKALVLQFANLMRGADQVKAPAANIDVPASGTYWAGQGGIYAGIRQGEDGELYHLIFADKDLGEHAWGEYGTDTAATSKVNGILNTTTLLEADGTFPAAEAAGNHSADGHHDFYLPSVGELNHAWQTIAEHFEKTWYWSSSQRSAYDAFGMYFDDGVQDYVDKSNELRVRPVRRLFIR